MKQNEQGLIDNFFEDLENYAKKYDIKIHKSSTGGSDSILGGDYIVSTGSKYILIEFKDNCSKLSTEGNKPKMNTICNELYDIKNRPIKILSLKCHFISWGEIIDSIIRMKFNKYFNAICNQSIFKTSTNLPTSPKSTTTEIDEIFIKKTISSNTGLNFENFNKYINWLLGKTTSNNGYTDLALIAKNDNGFGSYKFHSLTDLNNWIIQNTKKDTESKPTQRPNGKRNR